MTQKSLTIVPDAAPSGIQQAAEDYLAHVRAKGGSPRTEQYYSDVLHTVFLPWTKSVGVTAVDQLDQRSLDAFNAELLGRTTKQGKPLSKASVASYLRAVRAFLAWSKQEGLLTAGLKVQAVKMPRKVLDTLSRAEINEMESAADSERDKLIIRLLGDGGLRLAELLTLKPQSLIESGRDRYIKVEGKGSRERLVPLKPAVYQRLKRYAERGRPDDAYSDRIFISLRRRHASGGYEALDARAVQQMLQGVARKAGIRKRVNPHSFRHSFATNALRGGINVLQLQTILGHADLTMIANTYSHLNAADSARELMRVLNLDDQ